MKNMFEITEQIKDKVGVLALWVSLAMFGYLTPIMGNVNNFLHVDKDVISTQIGAIAVVATAMIISILYEFIKQFSKNDNQEFKPKTI